MTTTVLIEPPRDRPHLAGVRRPVYVWPTSRQSNPDDVLAGAEHMRVQFERLYGGHWIVHTASVPADHRLGEEPTCKQSSG